MRSGDNSYRFFILHGLQPQPHGPQVILRPLNRLRVVEGGQFGERRMGEIFRLRRPAAELVAKYRFNSGICR